MTCDARMSYTIFLIVHTGRQTRDVGEESVQQITFSPVCLLDSVSTRRSRILGTLQKKADIIPLIKASESWEVYSTEFGFNGSLTMVSYVSKKGMAVALLGLHAYTFFMAPHPEFKNSIIDDWQVSLTDLSTIWRVDWKVAPTANPDHWSNGKVWGLSLPHTHKHKI